MATPRKPTEKEPIIRAVLVAINHDGTVWAKAVFLKRKHKSSKHGHATWFWELIRKEGKNHDFLGKKFFKSIPVGISFGITGNKKDLVWETSTFRHKTPQARTVRRIKTRKPSAPPIIRESASVVNRTQGRVVKKTSF